MSLNYDDAQFPTLPTPERQADKERLHGMTELVNDVSTLIDLVDNSQRVSHINHTLIFPVDLLTPMQLPDIKGLGGAPDFVRVMSSKTRLEAEKDDDIIKAGEQEATISTSLKVEMRKGTKVAYIIRDSEDAEVDDVVQDEKRTIPQVLHDHIPIGMEMSGETEEEIAARQSEMPQVTRREFNELLMSLALGNTIDLVELEERGLDEKSLLDPNILTLIMEQMRQHAFTTDTTGNHIFEYFRGATDPIGDADLSFERHGADVKFSMSISSKKPGGPSLQAVIDTHEGLDLRFYVHEQGRKEPHLNPDIDDINRLRAVVLEEIDRIQDTMTRPLSVVQTEDMSENPEDVVVNTVTEDEKLERIRQEVDMYFLELDQDGFNPPDPRAA